MLNNIEHILAEVGKELTCDVAGGNCLNFAVAAQQAFASIGIHLQVLSVMRTVDGDDSIDGWFSHAVLYLGHKATPYFDDKLTIDHLGAGAFGRWSTLWNEFQVECGEPEEEFWLEHIEMPINEFLDFAARKYGCEKEGKLVNDLKLRSSIVKLIQKHPLFLALKLAA